MLSRAKNYASTEQMACYQPTETQQLGKNGFLALHQAGRK